MSADKPSDATISHIAGGMVALSFLIAMESSWGPVQLSPWMGGVEFLGLNLGAAVLCLWSIWTDHVPRQRPQTQPWYPGRVTITEVKEEADEEEPTAPLLPPGYSGYDDDAYNDAPTEWL